MDVSGGNRMTKQARRFAAVCLCAVAGSAATAAEPPGVRYSMFAGGLDLCGSDYRVRGEARAGRFSFRPPCGGFEWFELSVRCRVDGRPLPRFTLADGKTDVSEAARYTLTYTNADAVATLTFHPAKAVLALVLRRPAPLAVRMVEIGLEQRTDSDYLFDPSVGHQPYHEFPVRVPRRIAPGLASPPPWVFSYRKEGRPGCWSAALEPDPDKIAFAEFHHKPAADGRFGWVIEYSGTPARAGDLVLPPIVLRFGDADFFGALRRHVDDLLAEGKIPRIERKFPDWHARTLACTWRFQRERPRREQATEANCEAYVRMLEENGIRFGTLIIDDFWGREHGIWEADPAKWNDLRGFIDRQHAKGRRVLLWICTDAEGLPAEERIGGNWNLDSAAFRARLKRMARKILSSEPGCYDADGVKFDFTGGYANDGPTQRDFGCGYILRRFEMLSAALRAVKPDALLDYQCYNPYYAHTLTMLRLNDYFGAPEHGLAEMTLRAKIARICTRGALIDTDHLGFRAFPYKGAYDYFRRQHELGVRSLYLMPDDMKDAELMSVLKSDINR